MARAKKTDPNAPPEGGWLNPNEIDPKDPKNLPANQRPALMYADKAKVVRGRLEWVWKPVDAAYRAKCEALRNPPEPRVRTRSRG